MVGSRRAGAGRGHGRRDRSGRWRRRGSLTASEEEESAQQANTRAPLNLYSGRFLGAVPDPAIPTNAFVGAIPDLAAPTNAFVEAVSDPTVPTNIFYFFKVLILYFYIIKTQSNIKTIVYMHKYNILYYSICEEIYIYKQL